MVKIINEKIIAEELVKNNKLINDDTLTKIRCYIKYLKTQKISKREIRNQLDDLMLKNYDGFIMADWDELLQRMVNKYSKSKYCEYKKTNDEVAIYESELKTISEIGDLSGFRDIEIEKILFIMLVLAKINDSVWVNYTSEEIFKLARFKYKTKSDIRMMQREKLIYDLANFKDNKILKVTNYGKSPSMELLFLKQKNKEDEIEMNLKIEDIENIIVKYLDWRNKEDYNYCKVCGKEIINKRKDTKYCNKCSRNKQLEKQRLSMKKLRNKNNVK